MVPAPTPGQVLKENPPYKFQIWLTILITVTMINITRLVRSATCVAAYLMMKHGMSATKVCSHI